MVVRRRLRFFAGDACAHVPTVPVVMRLSVNVDECLIANLHVYTTAVAVAVAVAVDLDVNVPAG